MAPLSRPGQLLGRVRDAERPLDPPPHVVRHRPTQSPLSGVGEVAYAGRGFFVGPTRLEGSRNLARSVNQGGRVTDFGTTISRMTTLPSPVTSVVFPSISATRTLHPALPEREALLIPELLGLDENHLSELHMCGFRTCKVNGCTTCATPELEKPLQAGARARRLSRRGRRQPREW